MEIAQTYEYTIYAMISMALLMFFQVIVADVVGIRTKHTPGAAVQSDHNDLLFRVDRTVSNTNESIAIFILAIIICILSNAPANYTCYAAWAFVISRSVYTVFYYVNLKALRSVMFAVSMLSLASLLVIAVAA